MQVGLALSRGWDRLQMPLGGAIGFVIGVLLLAGTIHIAAILLVPILAKSDGWSRLAAVAAQDRFAEFTAAATGPGGAAGLDPLFVNSACRMQLGESPAGITVDTRDRFWSLALFDPKGNVIFSLNDRTAIEGRLDMIVVNRAQNTLLKKSPTAEIDLTIVTESPSNDVIALLRLFAPTNSARQDARRILQRAECLPAPSVIPLSG